MQNIMSRHTFFSDGHIDKKLSLLILRSREFSSNTSPPTPGDSSIPVFKKTFGNDDTEEYGWFSMENEPESIKLAAGTETGIQAIQRLHQETLDKIFPLREQDLELTFRAHNSAFIVTTKCFGTSSFQWGIGGYRIVKNRSGHFAQYQVLISYGGNTWMRWFRYSDFARLAKIAELNKWTKSVNKFRRLKAQKPFFRCLDVQYLLRKSVLLESFLRQVLFDSELEILLQFINDEV